MTLEDKASEKELSEIYHPLWNKFSDSQFQDAVKLFAGRLEVNGFDLNWFKGKSCLDAGCGSGRYVQAMLDLEADSVLALDLNPTIAMGNITDDRARIIKGNIREIPAEDEDLDFVCCNGVLHHTENPLEIFSELDRVLKPEGYFFLYVFDWESQDWETIDHLRASAMNIPRDRYASFLKQYLNLAENQVFAYLDLMYAPIQKKYTRDELVDMFKDYDVHFMDIPFARMDSEHDNRLYAKKRN